MIIITWNLFLGILGLKKLHLLLKNVKHDAQLQNWIHDTSPRRAKTPMEENRPIKSTLEKKLTFHEQQ